MDEWTQRMWNPSCAYAQYMLLTQHYQMNLDHPLNNPTPSDSEQSNALSFSSHAPSIRASSVIEQEDTDSDPKIPIHMGLSTVSHAPHRPSIC
jgi:hypothetical protein